MAASIFEQTSSLLLGLFDYNRENFNFDRRQRQIMEYQLLDKRIEQGGLWREDVRGSIGLIPEKVEIYLIVVALELTLTAVALCKGRMPFGAPSWLVACHTLSILTATMYLFMALWFGMHAFVAAQAYKVRILTQLVRLPVPSWQQLEGARTYLSDFETTGRSQALRVPFVEGAQESRVPAGAAESRESPGGLAADPWGLERRGDDIVELQPGVNTSDVQKQRHVWLMREACRFCQTYDAFCRISMSAGNCCLSSFFCYYCLGYVACELAAPAGAFVGMCGFGVIALLLMRHDMLLSLQETLVSACLLVSGEVICFVVVLACFGNDGDPGYVGYLMPIALASKATWLMYYLTLFRVTEHETGTFLPAAFASVLYLDPFGWAKHGRRWWRRGPQSSAAPARGAAAGSAAARSGWLRPGPDAPPAARCVDAAAPARPEDVGQAARPQQRGVPNLPYDITARTVGTALPTAAPLTQEVPFRSHTFGTSVREKPDQVNASTGPDVYGERPGLTPWRLFFLNTMVVSAMWWFAAGVTLVNAVKGDNIFAGSSGEAAETAGRLAPLLRRGPQIVMDSGAAGFGRLRGLACDPEGKMFATAAQGPDGRAALLLGRAAWDNASSRGLSVVLQPAPACPALGDDGPLDLSLLGCGDGGECAALVLPHGAERLVSCPLLSSALGNSTAAGGGAFEGTGAATGAGLATSSSRAASAPLLRSWLEDRGGAGWPEDRGGAVLSDTLGNGGPDGEGLFHPEDIASVSLAPCAAAGPAADLDCVVMGTTARRVVLMAMSRAADPGGAWAPKRVLWQGGLDVPGPGSLVAVGRRHVGVLDRGAGLLRIFDLLEGGRVAGSWRLPASAGAGGRWAAVCAGGGRLFAMGDEESPNLAQFFLPPELFDSAERAA